MSSSLQANLSDSQLVELQKLVLKVEQTAAAVVKERESTTDRQTKEDLLRSIQSF